MIGRTIHKGSVLGNGEGPPPERKQHPMSGGTRMDPTPGETPRAFGILRTAIHPDLHLGLRHVARDHCDHAYGGLNDGNHAYGFRLRQVSAH